MLKLNAQIKLKTKKNFLLEYKWNPERTEIKQTVNAGKHTIDTNKNEIINLKTSET